MPIPPRTGDNEVWTVKRGKRRRPRVIVQPGRDADHTPRSSGASEAPRSERSEAKARRQGTQRGREGHGEGRLGTELPLNETDKPGTE